MKSFKELFNECMEEFIKDGKVNPYKISALYRADMREKYERNIKTNPQVAGICNYLENESYEMWCRVFKAI